MDQDLRIYVITHKDYPIVKDNIHVPLLVGAESKEDTFGFICDNEGDNISSKNDQYCELTGLYWMWKNSDVDFIGLSHYRRYFAMGTLGKKGVINKEESMKLLENHDILVHERHVGTTVYNAISTMITKELLDESINIFNKVYPDFIEDMEFVLNDRKHFSNNMLVTDKNTFNNYCEWLFIYLNIIEKELDTNNLRIFGYISEICLSVYVNHFNLKVAKCPLDFVEGKSNIFANLIDKSIVLSYLFRLYWIYFIKDSQ